MRSAPFSERGKRLSLAIPGSCLIAFSNALVYDWQLITFPGCGGPPSVRFESVPSLAGRDDRMDSAAHEVTRVVELILDHAEHRPDESLGVIALGLPHARRVEAALEVALHDLEALRSKQTSPSSPTTSSPRSPFAWYASRPSQPERRVYVSKRAEVLARARGPPAREEAPRSVDVVGQEDGSAPLESAQDRARPAAAARA
jgi:hypothetical protein